MKKIIILLSIVLPLSVFADWGRPEVQCPEKILPLGLECPDFSEVRDPINHFPDSMSENEKKDWSLNKAPDLKACRYKEVLRREKIRPGSYGPTQIEIAWMIVEGASNSQSKFKSLINASKSEGVPQHILIGAITQESLLANLGVSPDGGNFSCGIAQLNILEWCQGVNSLPATERASLGWPSIDCAQLKTNFVSPFYELAKIELGNKPEYRISSQEFSKITFNDVASKLPASTPELQKKRFDAVSSFVKNCQNDSLSIRFKARILKSLFTGFVPKALKERELYEVGTTFSHSCSTQYHSSYYPLHTGWLLAVAAYNAGPRVTSIVEHYYKSNPEQMKKLTPKDLIEALYWGGKVKDGTNTVVFTGSNGKTITQSWYKSCVVQRHVTRVIQHVAKPGITLVRSLEDAPCSQVAPVARKNSSGVKN